MKKFTFILIFFTLSLNITNAVNLAEEIKNKELNKSNQEEIIEETKTEETIEDTEIETTEVSSNNNKLETELNNTGSTVTAEDLPETGPEEFILLFLTLMLSSAIFIRKRFNK